MDRLTTVKPAFLSAIGITGSIIANLLGGWDMALKILILFMVVDYITGLLVAGVFKKSTKTETGALESKAGAQGLARKGMTLLMVLVATQLDILSGTKIIRDAVIIGYIANELVSIIENAGLMGIYIPAPIKNAINILKQKTESDNNG